MTPDTKQSSSKQSSKGMWLRYGFIAILVVALGVLTGLLVESRSEAKSNVQPATDQSNTAQASTTQTSTQDWVYANGSSTTASAAQSSDAAATSAQAPAEVAALPTENLGNPGAATTSASDAPVAVPAVSLMPTPTPTPERPVEVAMAPAAPVTANNEPAQNASASTSSPVTLAEPAAPAASSQASQGVVGVVRGDGANLVDSPHGNVVEYMPIGNALTALGRSADSKWLYVTTATGHNGWVATDGVIIFDVDTLSVQEPVQDANTANSGAATNVVQAPAVDTPATNASALPNADSSTPAQAATEPGLRPAPVLQEGQVGATVALQGSTLNVRSGPGTNFGVIAKANPTESFVVVARNDDGAWLQITLPEAPDQVAWVSAQYVTLSAPLDSLPVSAQAASEPQANTASPAVFVSEGSAPAANTSAPAANNGELQGNLLIATGNGGAISVYNLATGNLRTLTTGFDPAISPDGRTVAFARGGGDAGLYLIDIDGNNEHRIYNGGQEIAAPSWSPDGQWIAFRRSSGSYACREVGFGICLPDNSPFLSSFPLGSAPQFGLSRVDRNGENFRDINSLTMSQAPDWNEAGIVYASHPSIEITADTPDGQTHRVVAEDFYQDPDWQPNGGRIVFESKRGTHWEIFAVNPDGTGVAALTRPVTALVDQLPDNVAPAWSPDGQHIVYLSNRDDQNSAGAWRVWVMNGDGSDQHPLSIPLDIQFNYANEQAVSWGV